MAGWPGRLQKLGGIAYGGDYNPEQWPEHVWREDMRLMREAGVNLVSVGIFSWALLQPNKDTYDFGWLDRLMDLLAENGIYACLATATASPPAWMAAEFPDTLAVDENGVPYSHGSRQHYSPCSETYRRFCAELVRRLAERYKDHPALAAWHVNNEYGCHVSRCYGEETARRFREWLKKRYGTLDELNERWGTNFWSQRYYDWDHIPLPRKTPTYANPGQQLDYARFMSDMLLECFLNECRILREITPDVPVTTNFMAFFKPADYFRWAEHLDIIAWDNYPEPTAGVPVGAASQHDLMRSLRGGQPFLLMEQAPSQVNWRPFNPVKRPGVMRLWSYQALARGADGIMFFQWRQSRAGAEKFHSGMVPHSGENSRVFREVRELGRELKRLGEIVGTRVQADVAIVFDWPNWWALELDSHPSSFLRYAELVLHVYRPLFEANFAVDFVRPDGDFSRYRLVVAPALYLMPTGWENRFERYVADGGRLLVTFFSSIVDENDRVHLGGYPAPLRRLLGLTVEEFDPMPPDGRNRIAMTDRAGFAGEYDCSLWADVIALEGAEPLAVFRHDFYAGRAAVTRHAFGRGVAYYVGTLPEAEAMKRLLRGILDEAGVLPVLETPQGVEATVRRSEDGARYLFLLNHNGRSEAVALPAGVHHDLLSGRALAGTLELPPNGVAVMRLSNDA